MGTEATFVRASLEHAEALAPNLRAEDIAECVATGYENGLAALIASLEGSDQAYAWLVGDTVGAMFGVSAVPDGPPGAAQVWFLTGRAFREHARSFVRTAPTALALLTQGREIVGNYIDARYAAAVRWAKWLGFDVRAPVPFGPHGLPFHPASLRR